MASWIFGGLIDEVGPGHGQGPRVQASEFPQDVTQPDPEDPLATGRRREIDLVLASS